MLDLIRKEDNLQFFTKRFKRYINLNLEGLKLSSHLNYRHLYVRIPAATDLSRKNR